MKMLINDPGNYIRESASGPIKAHADLIGMSLDPLLLCRVDASVYGKLVLVFRGGRSEYLLD
jgi:hypothetical protein